MEIYLAPLAILVLFIFVFLEYRKVKEKNSTSFRFENTVLNISFGVVERVFDLYFFIQLIFVFNLIKKAVGIFNIQLNNPIAWIVCYVLLDFIIYWYHRAGHRINFLWGAHVTHHQCEEFNLTVAFRNNVFPHIFRGVMMVILPIIGFSGEMVIICLTISGIWQFFIHTETINKMGWLEKVMMTPSHHRVHHGKNERYIDKNFGGCFIVWDKLFGTFQEELEKVKFGITDPINSWNPIKAYGHVWKDLFLASQKSKSLPERIKIWFGKPEDFYANHKYEMSSAKLETKASAHLKRYIIVQLVGTILCLLALMATIGKANMLGHLFFGILISSTALSMGFILNKDWFAEYVEYGRYVLIVLFFLCYLPKFLIVSLLMVTIFSYWFSGVFRINRQVDFNQKMEFQL